MRPSARTKWRSLHFDRCTASFGLHQHPNDDLIRAIEFEAALHGLLTSIAIDTSGKLHQSEVLLPYWGRLAFLRVMAVRQMPLPEAPESRPVPEARVGPKETVADIAPLGATLPETPPY